MAVMLLEWVFTSTFLILVVLALRAALGKRMSARLRYALWAVVLVRLLVPVQLFTFPLAGVWVVTEKRTEHTVYAPPAAATQAGTDDVLSPGGENDPAANFVAAPQAPDPPTVPDPPEPPDWDNLPGWVGYLGWMWLAGSAAAALVLLTSNLRFLGKLRRERVPLDGADLPLRVYAAAGLPSPCLFGLFRPAVYVTPEAAADPAMLRHVIAHEYTHYRQGDHIWSLLRCMALAAHWWNPLVWVAAVLSRRDAELACDEGALKRLGDGERAGYGNTLLALVTAKPQPGDLFRCATTMAGDKKSLRERIGRIAKAPKRVIWAVVAAVLVTALACVCAFGSARETDDPNPAPSQEPSVSAEPSALPSQGINVETAFQGTVPEDVLDDAEKFVRGRFEALRDEGILFGLDSASVVPDPPEVDDWRIERLTGPYWSGERYWQVLGINRRVELWNVVYAFHSTTPDRAMNLANGATELTGDGWLTPMNDGADYLVYELGEDGSRTLLTEFGEQGEWMSMTFRSHLRAKLASLGIPEDMADAYYMEEHAEFPLGPGEQPDLNRNGVPELVQTVDINEWGGQRLEVWEGEKLIYSEVGSDSHAGWNAVFLCTLDGEDCLLRYNPYMGQGWADYTYQLFTLSESGEEQVVRENSVRFDINFSPLMHESFDPEVIAAFIDEVNGLLANSVQLINTDLDLLYTFEREGRLHDSLWWLDNWEPVFVRDEGKSLLENLWDFQEAMKKEWYDEIPVVTNPSELSSSGGEPRGLVLSYQGKAKWFEAVWERFYPDDTVEGKFADLDGDGIYEIVVILQTGHGTGCLEQELHVFDPETLEEYDCSDVLDVVLGQVSSHADEERFYLTAPGVAAEIEKPEIDYNYEDSVCFDTYYHFEVEGGRLYGYFGAALDAALLCYEGALKVELRLDGRKLVSSGFEYLPEYMG